MNLVEKTHLQQPIERWREMSFGERIAFLCLSVALLGAVFGYRDFVRIKIGPIFILEILSALSLLALFTSEKQRDFEALRKKFLPIGTLSLFSAWGIVLVVRDVVAHGGIPENIQRYAQYCLIFIYPTLWIGLGHWFAERRLRCLEGLIYVVALISAAAAIFFPPFYDAPTNLMIVRHNISVGPILVVPALWLLASPGLSRRHRAVGFLCLVLVFFPVWLLWLKSMQRTTLGLLLILVFASPLFLLRSFGKSLLVSALAILFFGIGSVAMIELSHQDASSGAEVLRSLNHSDDTQQENPSLPSGMFQGRFRAFVWAQAIRDWRERPLTGVGFRVPIPSRVSPTKANDGSLDVIQGFSAEPVSGPHNSYLTILARMGFVGFLLFAAAGAQFLWRTRKLYFAGSLSNLVFLAIVWSGLIYALFNIGFEAPHNSVALWFAVGVLLARAKPVL